MICGGIDLGGTKIEARLFDGGDAQTRLVQRCDTPLESFDALLAALVDMIIWLEDEAGQPIPLGLSMAGVIDPDTGVSFAANLPSSGQPIAGRIAEACGRQVYVLNDCMAFAYSEVHGGAGADARTVLGLILGTGVGAGICVNAQLPPRHGGLAVEIGHLALPAAILARHDLPILPCGCGQAGCVETYVAGPGLSRLASRRLGLDMDPRELSQDPSTEAQEVLDLWAQLAAEALYAVQITLAPDRIVLGGGLSNMPGCANRLRASLSKRGVLGAPIPDIVTARFGDTSGARGAALYARQQNRGNQRHV